MRYRSKVLMAHFLGGRLVRVVWCEFKSESSHWKKAHLLLSTDAKLTPEQIIEAYGERWSIESMFNQLKRSWGLKEAWQQTRQTLHRWVHLTLVGYGLIQLLGYLDDRTVNAENSNRPIGEEVSRMQQSAYRTSSNGQYEQNSNFISLENIRWNNVAYSKL